MTALALALHILGAVVWVGGMFAIFAVIALVLSAVGLYAVTAYSVAQRTQEIGVRMALGAQSQQVMWLVMRRAFLQLAIGLPMGIAGAFAVGQLMQSVLDEIAEAGDAANDAWLKDPNGPIARHLTPLIATLGENMTVSRLVRYAGNGYVGQYIHQGGKIGVMVEFGGVTAGIEQREEFQTLVREIAMQIAAGNPAYARREDVPANVLEKEKAIYRAQMENSGKPANVLEKIIEGKLGAFYKQMPGGVLPDQESIRDPKMSVKQVIDAAGKALGAPVAVTRFARLKVGETGA